LGPRHTDIQSLAPRASDLQSLGPRATDIQNLAVREADLGTLGVASVRADMATLADIQDGTTATNAISNLAPRAADIQTLAPRAGDLQTLGSSANVTNMNTLADIQDGTVATNAITNVANNVTDVNNFADLYQIAGSDPATDGGGNALSGGDLYYSTTGNKLRVYNQSSGNWEDVAITAGSFLQVSNNLSDIADAAQARTHLGVITELSQDTSPALGGDLDMQSHSISSGVLGIKNTGSQSELRLYCETGNAHFTSIKSAPHAQYSGNLTLQLPATVGAAGQVLTDLAGNGVLGWATPSAGGSVATQMKFS